MNKKLLLFLFLVGAVFMLKESAYAATRKENIQSKGNISYEEGKIFFSAQDFQYLAGEIDNLEKRYKVNLIDGLNKIGTYFKIDGSTVYNEKDNEVKEEEQKIIYPFLLN